MSVSSQVSLWVPSCHNCKIEFKIVTKFGKYYPRVVEFLESALCG
jgi:hypothetical protein